MKTEEELKAEQDTLAAKEATATAAPAPAPDPMESVKAIAAEFRKSIEAMHAPAAAPAPVAQVDQAATLAARADAVKAEVNALAAEGKVFEANQRYVQFLGELQQAGAQDPTKHPLYVAQVASAKRAARQEHQQVMQRWEAEVESRISAMRAEERVSPDAWDRAVNEVRAAHITEILAEEQKAMETRLRKELSVEPTAPGSRGNTGGAAQDEWSRLSLREQGVARSLGLSGADYTKAKKHLEDVPSDEGGYGWRVPDLPVQPKPGQF